ncbi:MAG: nucleotidyltransferase domain-containing protein [Chthonomonadales bacterium]
MITNLETPILQITPHERQLLDEILTRCLPGVEVWAYGSRVGGSPRKNSDLDLVVHTQPAQRQTVSDLREELEESNLPFKVDMHVWDDLPPEFQQRIQANYVKL